MSKNSHHTGNGFINPYSGFEYRGFSDLMKWLLWDRFINGSNKNDEPDSLNFELAENDITWLRNNTDDFAITWVGHSSLLIQIDGLNIITDPVWSDRVSPVSFVGPARYVKPGIAFDELSDIDIILISHDHYDHLDEETIKKFGNDVLYLVPLGVGKFLEGLDISNYQEFDWWDEIKFNNVKFVCVPAQHFSGRTMFDRNKTLWSGWVISGKSANLYFAGDTGYFPGFKEIAERLGPFTVAAIPIGAYEPRWFMGPVHVSPEEAVRAYLEVKATYFVPIHWGTFKLADEPLSEPPKLLLKEIIRQNLDKNLFRILKHGETFLIPNEKEISKQTM